MKNIIVMLMLMLLPVKGYCVDASFVKIGGGDKNTNGNLANEDGLTYNRNYYVNPGNYSGDKVSSVITYSSVTFSDVTFTTTSYTAGSGDIAITAHGLTTALPVLLRQTAGTIPPPLVAETTYYAIPISANIVRLATTSVQAQASDYIVMGSSFPQVGTQTYTLIVPTTMVGNPVFTYQASNDGTNFFNLGVSSTVAGYTYGGVSWEHDFSTFNYTTLKLVITSPTTGALRVKAAMNIRQ